MLDFRDRSRAARPARRLSPTVRGWIVVAIIVLLAASVLWGALATVRRADQAVRIAEEAREAATAATQQGRGSNSEAFTAATQSLAASGIEERLGAVHTLRALATADGPGKQSACDTLSSFVVRRAPTTKEAPVGPDITTALSALATDCGGARRFTGVDLSGADLTDGALRGLTLRSSNLNNAQLRSADLSGATLVGTSLSGADLRYADLRGATLYAVDLSGAQLAAARLDGVIYDRATTWPDGFSPPPSGTPPTTS